MQNFSFRFQNFRSNQTGPPHVKFAYSDRDLEYADSYNEFEVRERDLHESQRTPWGELVSCRGTSIPLRAMKKFVL